MDILLRIFIFGAVLHCSGKMNEMVEVMKGVKPFFSSLEKKAI